MRYCAFAPVRGIAVAHNIVRTAQRSIIITHRSILSTQRSIPISQRCIPITQGSIPISQRSILITQRSVAAMPSAHLIDRIMDNHIFFVKCVTAMPSAHYMCACVCIRTIPRHCRGNVQNTINVCRHFHQGAPVRKTAMPSSPAVTKKRNDGNAVFSRDDSFCICMRSFLSVAFFAQTCFWPAFGVT